MKNKILVANWKSNKTKSEAKNWLEQVAIADLPKDLEIIILPSFPLLDYVSSYVRMNSLPFRIGAQDLSPFGSGAYTGEVSSLQIKEFADYVLVGHSERRTNFSEDKETVNNKIEKAVSEGLIPIVCISDMEQLNSLNFERLIIAYEPIKAIGTGNPEDPRATEDMAKKIKTKIVGSRVIYGGSVNWQNVKDYINLNSIEGVLVGGQSLDPESFINILKNAS